VPVTSVPAYIAEPVMVLAKGPAQVLPGSITSPVADGVAVALQTWEPADTGAGNIAMLESSARLSTTPNILEIFFFFINLLVSPFVIICLHKQKYNHISLI
jgi:hypothetical protein